MYKKWLRQHVVFDFPIENRKREIYLHILDFILTEYHRSSDRFYFNGVSIVVKEKLDHPEDLSGLETRTRIELLYEDLPSGVTSMRIAHALLHTFFLNLFDTTREARYDAMNLVHYAANVGPPYVKNKEIGYLSWADRLFFRKRVKFRVFYFDLNEIFRDREKIKRQIADHDAPEGPNPYSRP